MHTKIALSFLLCTAWFSFASTSEAEAEGTLFRQIVQGLDDSKDTRIVAIEENVGAAFFRFLESDEQQAGQFICDMLQGNIPGAFEDLATDVFEQIEGDIEGVVTFVEDFPNLATDILQDIVADGADVASIIEEIFVNPKGALTVIEGDAKTIYTEITNEAKSIWNDLTCLFKDCPASGPVVSLSSSCAIVQAAATTTVMPTLLSTYTGSQAAPIQAAPTYATQTQGGTTQQTSGSSTSGSSTSGSSTSGSGTSAFTHGIGILILSVFSS